MNKNCTKSISFTLRIIQNRIKAIINKSFHTAGNSPKTQLQAGIMGYLFYHQNTPIYQKNIEEEFNISRATATNTLQCMEKSGLITRVAMDKDARLKRITMAEDAKSRHEKVEQHMTMMDNKMLDGMSDAEKKELMRLLHIVNANLEKLEHNEL